MYKLILDEGVVIDDFGHQVAPADNVLDPRFVAYHVWLAAGKEPEIVPTRG